VSVNNSGNGNSSAQSSDGVTTAEQRFTQQLSRMEQRHAEQMQQMQQQLTALTSLLGSMRSAASFPYSSTSPRDAAGKSNMAEPSASSALPIPPQVSRGLRRQSHGVPSSLSPSPSTPATARRTARRVSFEGKDGEEENGDEQGEKETSSSQSSVEQERQWERASKAIAQVVKPFYGELGKDNRTVIDWVEKVDTVFSIRMKDRQEGRLDLVRQMLEGSALKWMNRRVQELNEKVSSGEFSGVVEWDVLRQPFIDAHLGLNTIETFKAELRALRLGSKECPTPVELNKRFDHVAELAYPDRLSTSMATVLGDEYRSIIAASDQYLYRNVERNVAPQTLDEWKKAVARFWAAELRIRSSMNQSQSGRAVGSGEQRGRGWSARSGAAAGRGRGGISFSSSSSQSLNAMLGPEENASGEGEELVTEGESNPELNAAFRVGGQRGGRGGRGGRGRGIGKGGPPMPAEIQKLYNEERCFRCKAVGHVQAACPTPPKPRGREQVNQANSQLNE
jgi:hypothetical protein